MNQYLIKLEMRRALKDKLNQFGLDPKEWMLKQESGNRWLIQHLHTRDFKMVGLVRTENQSWDWGQIELLYPL